MNGFRLFLEDTAHGVKVDYGSGGRHFYLTMEDYELAVGVMVQVKSYPRPDYCQIAFDSKHPGASQVHPEVVSAIVENVKKKIADQKKMYQPETSTLYVRLNMSIKMNSTWQQEGQRLLAAVAEHMPEIGQALNPALVFVGPEDDKPTYKDFVFVTPPDFSIDWRPTETTPEDFYAR